MGLKPNKFFIYKDIKYTKHSLKNIWSSLQGKTFHSLFLEEHGIKPTTHQKIIAVDGNYASQDINNYILVPRKFTGPNITK